MEYICVYTMDILHILFWKIIEYIWNIMEMSMNIHGICRGFVAFATIKWPPKLYAGIEPEYSSIFMEYGQT